MLVPRFLYCCPHFFQELREGEEASSSTLPRPSSLDLPHSHSASRHPATHTMSLDEALRQLPLELLLILTYAPTNSFLTLTVKRIRNLPHTPHVLVKTTMYR